MKTVSVIITTYNAANTIGQTLNSILTQEGKGEHFDMQVIVVDDCSEDTTVEILKEFDVEFYATESNTGGPNHGRNIALEKVNGDYICIADHDDVWLKDKLLKMLPHVDKAPIVSSGYLLVDSSSGKNIERRKSNEPGYITYSKNETFLSKLTKSLDGQTTYLGSLLYDASLKHIEFEEHFGVVDFDWILRLFEDRSSIEICECLYTRIVDGTNLSLNDEYRRKDFYYSLMFIERYEYKFPKQVKLAYKRIHGSRARYYYLIDNMRKARFYFLKSHFNWKNLAYYLTTFAGSRFVKKRFNIFG